MILFCPKVHSCQDLVVNFKPPHVIHLLAEATEGTGWSKVTVTNNISLTNLKNAKNCLTQWFLESFYAAVLVFWCLKMIRWEFSLHFNVEPNWWVGFSKTQPCMDWTLKYPQKTPKQLCHPQNTAQTTKLFLRHPQDILKQHQTQYIQPYIFKHSRWFSGVSKFEELNKGVVISSFWRNTEMHHFFPPDNFET